ncbi:carbon-nitrogen hydrolase family protein [Actinomycetospora soli]|uniref:carbon-nitrogen hydrolase family protein n=1 Tax=Actinomycetospora soli TaxID=2893887 RepID=UPI001E635218|nr:carbon-nitrogen hydrolase family protein [Actinomycetospora soli]MCD2191476.1 carbon-nitrogen hydrolase family protein [Actinomycetospora soli]
MRRPLTVAAAQPTCRPRDVAANAVAHARAVRAAESRLVVFPELSLTGYVLDADDVDPDDPALDPLRVACAGTETVALVGAPVAEAGRRSIATLRVDGENVTVAYRKTWLGAAEEPHFAAGDGPTVLTVDGWRLGLALSRDTRSARHPAGTAALGVDAYVAGVVHRPDELPEQEARATVLARACRAYVVLASAAGAVGPDYPRTCGGSGVWSPDGLAITRIGADPDDLARATLVREPRPDGG